MTLGFCGGRYDGAPFADERVLGDRFTDYLDRRGGQARRVPRHEPMSQALPPATRTRFEKAAMDNGFDQEIPPHDPNWLGFRSTKSPLWIWLSIDGSGRPVVAFTQLKVATALAPPGSATETPMPLGARAILSVADVPSLHSLLRRAFQLSRSLPDEPLRVFEQETKSLPRGTEVERLVVQRIGQGIFRDRLLDYWEGRCAITGLAVPELLRASHIKPWAVCATDTERLDVFNGLLLAPHLDAAFDLGFITVADDGAVVVSALLRAEDRHLLGLDAALRVSSIAGGHRAFLPWHREHQFRS